MKQISIFFGIIFFITGCAQTDYDYKTENIILDCFYQHHKDHDIDVKSTIDKIENILIKHKILENKSGESYIRIIEQIRDKNDLDINNPDLLTDIKSIDYIPSSVFCRDTSYASLLDSSSLADSKLKYVIGIFDSIRVKGDISPTLIAEEILEVFNANDFENDYYKTIGLVMFSNMIKMNDYESGIARKLPPMPEKESTKIEEQNIFVILVNAEDKILADGEPVEISELNGLVKEFLLETSDKTDIDLPLIGKQKTSKGMISIRNERGTSYEVYIAVQNELTKAYDEIRDKFSLKFFNLPFDKLDKEKQKVIIDLIPYRISEAEPGT
jgi:biopolymer transport protein ExbD